MKRPVNSPLTGLLHNEPSLKIKLNRLIFV